MVQFLNMACDRNSRVAKAVLSEAGNESVYGEHSASYICVSKDNPNLMSYLTEDRVGVVDDEYDGMYFNPSNDNIRYKSKPLKVIAKIFNMEATDLTDVDKEHFMNLWKEHFKKEEGTDKKKDYRVQKYGSRRICEMYHYESYGLGDEDRGNLGGSCMKHDSRNHFMEFYQEQGDVVSILVLLRKNSDGEEKVWARALLWNYVETEECGTIKLMDRIYTYNTSDEVYLKDYAKRNGYYFKETQSYDYKSQIVSPDNKVYITGMKVNLKTQPTEDEDGQVPYIDTFTFYDNEGGFIHNGGCTHLGADSYEKYLYPATHEFTDHSRGHLQTQHVNTRCKVMGKYFREGSTVRLLCGERAWEGTEDMIRVRDEYGNRIYALDEDDVVRSREKGIAMPKNQAVFIPSLNDWWYSAQCVETLIDPEKNVTVMYPDDLTVFCSDSEQKVLKNQSAYIPKWDAWVHWSVVSEYIEMKKEQEA